MESHPTELAEPDLLAQLHHHSRRVIETELRRLSRRVPTLDPAELDVISETLADLSDTLIIDRLRNAPPDTASLLCRLFDTVTTDDRARGRKPVAGSRSAA